jgi:hypothetical protein
LLEYFFDRFLGLFGVFEEMCDFFESDGSGMIHIEVLKGLLKVLFSEELFGVDTCNKELGVIDMPGAIGINDSHEELNPFL